MIYERVIALVTQSARGRNFVKVKPMGNPNAQMSDSEKLLEASANRFWQSRKVEDYKRLYYLRCCNSSPVDVLDQNGKWREIPLRLLIAYLYRTVYCSIFTVLIIIYRYCPFESYQSDSIKGVSLRYSNNVTKATVLVLFFGYKKRYIWRQC